MSPSFHEVFIDESDTLNAISWISKLAKGPWSWKFYYILKEISLSVRKLFEPFVVFCHDIWPANDLADLLAKHKGLIWLNLLRVL